MLLVKTHLAPDAFGGTGLFASEFIRKGTVVWKYDPGVDQFFTIEEYLNLMPEKREKVSHYGYRARINGTNGVLYSHDNDKYINHSESPNIRCRYDSASAEGSFDSRFEDVVAAEDIQAQTEITMNYHEFNLPEVPPELYRNIRTCFDFLDPSNNADVLRGSAASSHS